MNSWIYLKKTNTGYDDLKAAALASVLNVSPDHYNVVHTNVVSRYMKGLNNVKVGNPSVKEGDNVKTLNLPDYAPFSILCTKISTALNLPCRDYSPYLGFAREENEIDRQLSEKENFILFCYFINERDSSLVSVLNAVVKKLNNNSLNAISCGSKNEPIIKGVFDFRELIQIDEIIKNRDKIKVIITSTALVKEIGVLLDIPVVYLYSYSYIVYYDNSEIVESCLMDYAEKLTNTILDICNKSKVSKQTSVELSVKHRFEVPYNFDEEIIPYYANYLQFVNFLFLPPYSKDSINTRKCLQSKIKGFSYMPQTREEYEFHLHQIKKHKLRYVVLWQDMNSIISKDILDYYTKLGASGFIVANDENAKIIKDYNPKLIVVSSIVQRLCKDISRKDFEDYDYCVLFYPFNRSLDAIKKLSNIRKKLVVMPNSFCHTDCTGVQHWFAKDIGTFNFEKMCPAYNDDTKSTFIYPEHLYLFDDYVGGYKLQGREWTTDNIVTMCEAYFNRKTPGALVPQSLNDKLKELHSQTSLDDYYNYKTNEIIHTI